MINKKFWPILLSLFCLFLTACGSSSSDNEHKITSLQITASVNPVPAGFETQLTATAYYNDNTANNIDAEWQSLTPEIATVSNSGLVTTLTKGTASIMATVNGFTNEYGLTVSDAEIDHIVLTSDSDTIPFGLTTQYYAEGHFSDHSHHDISFHSDLVWFTSNDQVATINKETTTADIIMPGDVTFTASLNNTVSNEVNLEVTSATIVDINIDLEDISLAVGYEQELIATAILSDTSEVDISGYVTWESSIEGVLELPSSDKPSLFTAKSVGTTIVTANYTNTDLNINIDSSNESQFTVEHKELIKVTVQAGEGINGNNQDTMALGESINFIATAYFSDGNSKDVSNNKLVYWQSDNADYASVTLSGEVKAEKETTEAVTITAYSPLFINLDAEKNINFKAITITEAMPSEIIIEAENANLIISVGHQQQFSAIAIYTDGNSENIDTEDALDWKLGAYTNDAGVYISQDGLFTYSNVSSDGPTGVVIIASWEEKNLGKFDLYLPGAEELPLSSSVAINGTLTSYEAEALGSYMSGTYVEDYTETHFETAITFATMNYNLANQHCENLLYNGFSNWRLPTDLELIEFYQTYLIQGADEYGNAQGWVTGMPYWSSTEHSDDIHLVVSLKTGDSTATDDRVPSYASCVRPLE